MFDPQFYLPSSQKRKLKDYAFFPETIANGFDTTSFSTSAKEAAKQCIAFQKEQGFRNIVIPTRYLNQMFSDFIEQQEVFSVEPFLNELGTSSDKPICLTLALTNHMIEDRAFRTKILNWVTKYPEIDQIYLIYVVERDTKQIQSSNFLQAALTFSTQILDSGLDLIIGYQNTESLLFSIFDGITLTYGNFENTRIFSLDKFLVTDEERRGPKPRIYLPGLLNWVRYEDAKKIQTACPKVWEKIYEPTRYSELVLNRAVDPHFGQSELYKHHIICMSNQLSSLQALSPKARGDVLIEKIKAASSFYEEIDKAKILIEKHGDGKHLNAWDSAIKQATDDLL